MKRLGTFAETSEGPVTSRTTRLPRITVDTNNDLPRIVPTLTGPVTAMVVMSVRQRVSSAPGIRKWATSRGFCPGKTRGQGGPKRGGRGRGGLRGGQAQVAGNYYDVSSWASAGNSPRVKDLTIHNFQVRNCRASLGISFMVDSGATISIMTEGTYRQGFNQLPLRNGGRVRGVDGRFNHNVRGASKFVRRLSQKHTQTPFSLLAAESGSSFGTTSSTH